MTVIQRTTNLKPTHPTVSNELNNRWATLTNTNNFHRMRNFYKSFEFLTANYNRITIVSLPLQNLNTLIMTSTSLYGSVSFFGKISLEAYLVFPSTLIAIFIYSSILYNFSASLNIGSEEFISSWNYYPGITRNKLMYKYKSSCFPLRVNIGFYYYIHRYTLVTYISIILGFTINLLLTYRVE